ncbi:unnamed protein product [Linum tenue]|uniref:Uncharacterized protein n=1 Tax=Linum tenue TaxID=586396 RepID=A0AAV0J300_9ROSI|nr:unnamed protein product [Linum tenue]
MSRSHSLSQLQALTVEAAAASLSSASSSSSSASLQCRLLPRRWRRTHLPPRRLWWNKEIRSN